MKICKDCLHSVRVGVDLFCHRYPPTSIMVPVTRQIVINNKIVDRADWQPAGVFPVTNDNNSCGEFSENIDNPKPN